MKRDDLFQPGEYIALPKSLAADTRLNAAAKIVWAVIADRLGSNNTAWPDFETIACDASVSVSSVTRAVADLERVGWCEVERRDGKSNKYTLIFPSNPAQKEHAQVD